MMKCLCEAYEQELDESAKLIRDALGYDPQTRDVWNRRYLIELISEYKRIEKQLDIVERLGSV